jgi:hypothetical protein
MDSQQIIEMENVFERLLAKMEANRNKNQEDLMNAMLA